MSDAHDRIEQWIMMQDVIRRRIADRVWIPLRMYVTARQPDGREEVFALGSIAFPASERENAEKLSWDELGLSHSGGPYPYSNQTYKPAEVYQRMEGVDMGVDFIFEQHPGNGYESIWHINQDLILALNLVKEGNEWLKADEGFAQVIRETRSPEGQIVAIEIRSEFLKDYLAARGLALRIAHYQRREIRLEDASHIAWRVKGVSEERPHHRFTARVHEIDETGAPYGAGVAIFHMGRTDVYPEDDVPVFGTPNDKNTYSNSRSFTRDGKKLFLISGELWREEWIEPASRSERVRGDRSAEMIWYLTDADGSRTAHWSGPPRVDRLGSAN